MSWDKPPRRLTTPSLLNYPGKEDRIPAWLVMDFSNLVEMQEVTTM
jgi:hypothetical protein